MDIPKFEFENSDNRKRKRKFNDLSGCKFNHLTVLYRTSDYITPKGVRHIRYACLCDCGSKTVVRATSLKNGHTVSCGCNRSKALRSKPLLENLTGKRYGKWSVLKRADNRIGKNGKGAIMWSCRCDCGVIRDVHSKVLKDGTSQSCGCLKIEKLSKNRALFGSKFNRWLVIGQSHEVIRQNNRNVKVWYCRCDCGNEKYVHEQSLLKGKSKSCGCYRKEKVKESSSFQDLTGNRYGSWTVIKREDDRFYPKGGRAQMWHCVCDCGNENIVASNMLKSTISQSCGCIYESKFEKIIKSYLDENGYAYKQCVHFEDLIGIGGGFLSYDFAIYDKNKPFTITALIEYQGEQHYKPVSYFGGVTKFQKQIEHDQLKRFYAIDKGIPLLEIPYIIHKQDDIFKFIDLFLHSII